MKTNRPQGLQRPVYTERHQCYDVASDIALIELPKFLNKPSELQPQLTRYDASVDADPPIQSLTFTDNPG